MSGEDIGNAFKRREILESLANPGGKDDYVIGLRGRMRTGREGEEATVVIRYIPDRLILKPESLESYLRAVEAMDWDSLERIAVTITKDIGNQLVTRWVQATLRCEPTSTQRIGSHDVSVEDRQPDWRNDDLLWRLPPIDN